MTQPDINPSNEGAVAIIGLALRVPGASTPEELWSNLANGVCSISRFDDEQMRRAGVPESQRRNPNYVPAGGILKNIDLFDAAFFGFTPREAACLSPQNRLLFECCWESLEMAGYDPQAAPGRTGVFCGQSTNTYWNRNVEPALDEFDVGLDFFSNPDCLSTLIAYKLDLRGPAMTVQSFCSTSLLAVHQARQSLLEGECDMALAGGTSVQVPQEQGYLYLQESLYTPDGVVRAFDAEANGTLFSNAVATVLLKRLDDALADRDPIIAVIRGSAANNDGRQKAGYNAPSVEGQSRAIKAALADAGVSSESISYVECHGTGTILGDPIEVAALIKAYRRKNDSKRLCALGSIKPNLGHTDRASGVTSLIKTALALQHRQLPGLLNFDRLNPRIELAGTPFYISKETRPWEAGDEPRRAGVTSLGYGGTNVHLVLEEAPSRPSQGKTSSLQAILLSARTPTALRTASDNLASHLASHPETSLADVALTLQSGRTAFNFRRLCLGTSTAEMEQFLRQPDVGVQVTVRKSRVHFVFPGLAWDRAEALAALAAQPDLQRLLAAELPAGQSFAALPDSSARFYFERALAKTWMDFGITPASFAGSGCGAWVADSLSGRLPIEAALAGLARDAQAHEDLSPAPVGELVLLISLEAPQTLPERVISSFTKENPGSLIPALGRLWLAGVEADWKAVHASDQARRIPLPRYPFERSRHWLEDPGIAVDAPTELAASQPAQEPPSSFFVNSWRRLPPLLSAATASCRIVVLEGADSFGEALVKRLEQQGDTIICLRHGEKTGQTSERNYSVDTKSPAQIHQLLNRIRIRAPKALLLCVGRADGLPPAKRATELFLSVLHWIQGAAEVWPDKDFRFDVLAQGMVRVADGDALHPGQATLVSLLAVAAQEFTGLRFRCVDLSASPDFGALAREVQTPEPLPLLALRGKDRWAPSFEALSLENSATGLAGLLRKGGVYLITGGLGGIGYSLAQSLADKFSARLVLIARHIPVPGEQSPQARRLAELNKRAGGVLALAADVSQPEAMQAALDQARQQFGHIDGVIHAAGISGSYTLDRLKDEEVGAVMAPKVQGTSLLLELLRKDPPDFVVFCSSLAAVAPSLGQGVYAAANAFLDAMALQSDFPAPMLSVNWNSWRNLGMAQNMWNRSGRQTAVQHSVFQTQIRMPDGVLRFEGQLDARRHWMLADHLLSGKPTLPGSGLIELAIGAFQLHQGGFAPVEISKLAFVSPLQLSPDESASIRVSLVPAAEGFDFLFERLLPDQAPVLHGYGKLRALGSETPKRVSVPEVAGPEKTCDALAPDAALQFGRRWQCLQGLRSDMNHSIARLRLPDDCRNDLAENVLHAALFDLATSIHPRSTATDGSAFMIPVGYRSIRLWAPLEGELVSTAILQPDNSKTRQWDLTITSPEGAVLVEVEGFLLSPWDELGTGFFRAPTLPTNPFEADSIKPEEGIDLFLRLPLGQLSQIMVSRHPRWGANTPPCEAKTETKAEAETKTQETPREFLTALWKRILGVDLPRPNVSFFELGGNSLGATRILTRIRETWHISIGYSSFFAEPTIEALARKIEASIAAKEDREEGVL